MSSVSVLLLILACAVSAAVSIRSFTEGYCWRDFRGKIPKDALKAALDRDGKPIYIGQVLFEDKLIPGEIFEGDNNIYYEIGERAWSTNKTIKILCTKNPENFNWISTSISGVSKLTDAILIQGGKEPGFLTYIGRRKQNDRTYIGKIVCRSISCLAFYGTDRGTGIEFHTFEILSYKPTNENT